MKKIFLIVILIFSNQYLFAQMVDSSLCNFSIQGNLENLGLYGGPSANLTSAMSGGRIFAAASNPYSLYFSDDTCKTWIPAYPDDSLLYECGTKGWTGNSSQVLTNSNGWVAALSGTGSKVTSLISYSNGDTGTWSPLVNMDKLESFGLKGLSVSGIALTDYFVYTASGRYGIKQSSIDLSTADIINLDSMGFDTTFNVVSIAAANKASGYPMYLVIDTAMGFNNNGEMLIAVQSNNKMFIAINLPSLAESIHSIFVPLNCVTGDTIIMNVSDNLNETRSYRSYNGGATWTEITFHWKGNVKNVYNITDVDYFPAWANKIVLNAYGLGVSYDLGTTWNSLDIPSGGLAFLPTTNTLMLKSYNSGIKLSTAGHTGPFSDIDNKNFENITINKFDYTTNKTVTYIATNAGLAYSTALNDTTIDPVDKWQSPYGDMIPFTFYDQEGLTAIAINKSDTTNLVGGNQEGLYTTTSGPNNFSVTKYWSIADGTTRDIKFINDTKVLVVTDGDTSSTSGKGNIYRSTNKGLTWDNVTPADFTCGNTIEVIQKGSGYVIYVGSGCVSYNDEGYLWKSTDMGLTWSKVNSGPNAINDITKTKLCITDIEAYPGKSDTLLISAKRVNPGYYFATVRTNDGGLTYQYVDLGEYNNSVSSIAINKDDTSITYYAIDYKIIEKEGDSVSVLYTGWPETEINEIKYGSIIVGTSVGFYGTELDAGVVVGLKVLQFKNGVKVYPIPASDEVKVEIPSTLPFKNFTMIFYNSLGKIMNVPILAKNDQVITFDTRALSNGIYHVRIKAGYESFEGSVLINK